MTVKPRVYVMRPIPPAGMAKLNEFFEVELQPEDRPPTRQELIGGVKRNDYLYALLGPRIDAEVMDTNPNLKAIANMAVGYDNIDVPAATARGIPVTNTPGVLTETTADLTWSLMMAVARRICEGERFLRAGKYQSWGPLLLLGTDVYGKTLGIIGFGRIGRAIARRAMGFDMRVLYYDEFRPSPEEEAALKATYVPLERLLAESDFVTVHAPLMSSTRHLIDERTLSLMKHTAFLVNAARGPIVDEQALVDALRSGRIAGAALDVFEQEPKVHPGLLQMDNVVIVPHIGSATHETRNAMASLAAENLIAVLQGQSPPNLVNAEVLK